MKWPSKKAIVSHLLLQVVLTGTPVFQFPVRDVDIWYRWFLMCIPIQTKSLAVHFLNIDKSPIFLWYRNVNDAMSLFLVIYFFIIHVWCFYLDFMLHIHEYLGGGFLCLQHCIYFSLNFGGNKFSMVWRQTFNKLWSSTFTYLHSHKFFTWGWAPNRSL